MKVKNVLRAAFFQSALSTLLLFPYITVPLIFDPEANLSFEPIKVAALIFIAGIALSWMCISLAWMHRSKDRATEPARSVSEGGFIGAKKWLTCSFWGYFFSILFSTIFSPAPYVSFWGVWPRFQGLLLWSAILVLVFGIRRLARLGEQKISQLLNIALATGCIVSVLGIGQVFFPWLTQWFETDLFRGRIFSTMGHPNYLADYLILLIPLLYWKFLESRKWCWWVGSGGVMGIALLLTLSRGAMLGLVMSLIFFALVYAWQHGRRRTFLLTACAPLLIVLFVISVHVFNIYRPIDDTSLLHRFVITGENMRSIQSRFILWPAVLDRIFERPLLGYGPDTFAMAFAPRVPAELLHVESFNSYPDRAHNFFLDSLMSVGVVGTGFLLALLVCIFWIVVRVRNLMILSIGSALFGHIISQQFEFSLSTHILLFWTYIAIILGYVRAEFWPIGRWKRGRGTAADGEAIMMNRESAWGALLTGGLLLIAAASLFFSGYYFYHTFTADRLANAGKYEQASQMMPSRVEYALSEVRRVVIDLADEEIASEASRLRSYVHMRLDHVKTFTGDLDYRPYFYEGIYEMMAGESERSYAAFERALIRAPSYPPIYKAYGKSLLAGGRYGEAAAQFQRYIDLAPPHVKQREAYVAGTLPAFEMSRYEIFYKENPGFDEVFGLLEAAKLKLKSRGESSNMLQTD